MGRTFEKARPGLNSMRDVRREDIRSWTRRYHHLTRARGRTQSSSLQQVRVAGSCLRVVAILAAVASLSGRLSALPNAEGPRISRPRRDGAPHSPLLAEIEECAETIPWPVPCRRRSPSNPQHRECLVPTVMVIRIQTGKATGERRRTRGALWSLTADPSSHMQ